MFWGGLDLMYCSLECFKDAKYMPVSCIGGMTLNAVFGKSHKDSMNATLCCCT